MSRIIISCIVLVICVYSCLAFTLNVRDLAEQRQMPYGNRRHKRMSLGVSVGFGECEHIGRTCSIWRDKTDKPTQVNIVPCCEHLVCAGIGPYEKKNGFGQAHSSDDLYSTGICSLSLDNNQGPNDKDKYIEYVQGL